MFYFSDFLLKHYLIAIKFYFFIHIFIFFFSDKPSKPLDLKVTDVHKESVVFSWNPPSNDGGCEITKYIIEKRDSKRTTWLSVDTVEAKKLTLVCEKLTEGVEYFFRVAAENKIGQGEFAEMKDATVPKLPFCK